METTPTADTAPAPTRAWGLLRRRTLWVPTWRMVALVVILGALFVVFVVRSLYGFLAVDELAGADLIVAEGWLDDTSLAKILPDVIREGGPRLCVTGGPLASGSHLAKYRTFAELAAATLEAQGVPRERMIVAPAPGVRRHRSYQSAKSLREKLRELGVEVRSLDVYTLGAHARRSRLIYQRVFGDDVEIGVRSIPPCTYDPDAWWSSSAGGKEVLMEAMAYLWERFLSRGPASGD